MVLLMSSSIALAQDFCKGDFNYNGNVAAEDVTVFLQHFGRSIFNNPCPPDGPAPVAYTGQTISYTSYDDAFFSMGQGLPPGVTTRFNAYDDYHGITYIEVAVDNLTGLVWYGMRYLYMLGIRSILMMQLNIVVVTWGEEVQRYGLMNVLHFQRPGMKQDYRTYES